MNIYNLRLALKAVQIFVVFLFFGSSTVKAQFVPLYTFSQSSGTYGSISTGTVVASGTGLDDQRYVVPLPFNFYFNNVVYNDVRACVNGYIAFGATDPGTNQIFGINSSVTGFSAVCAFSMNLASLSAATELRYTTSGTAPNRTFIIQWKNFGYPSVTNLDVSFQIRLQETTNVISFVYGSMSMNGTTNAQIGLRGMDNTEYNSRNATTTWTGTTSGNASSTVNLTSTVAPASGYTFTYTPPPNCAAPANQPTLPVFTPALTSIAGTFTASSGGANKYLVVRTPNVTLTGTPTNGVTYSAGNTIGNGTVVYAGNLTSFNNTGLTQSTYYTYTIFAYNDVGCLNGPVYKTANPLVATVSTTGPRAYTWIPTSGSHDFQIATNWTPARTYTHSNDTLYFNNGGTVTVTNVPNAGFKHFEIANNTAITVLAASSSGNTIGITGLFNITSGSILNLDPVNTFQININSSGSIGGIVNIPGSSKLDGTSGTTNISGTINVTGATASVINTASSGNNMIFGNGSTYNHMRDGGAIPKAYYSINSTVNIGGAAATAPTITTAQDFGNLTWNCPGQVGAMSLASAIDTIRGNFTIVNTNSYALKTGAGSSTLVVNGNFIQQAGTYQLSTSTDKLVVSGNMNLLAGTLDLAGGTGPTTLTLAGDLIQNAAHVITKNGTNQTTMSFFGSTQQHIVLNGLFNAGGMKYVLKNPAGAELTGTSGVLPVASGATNTINWGNWSGTGRFEYGATTTTLIYSSALQTGASAVEWPAVNGPQNVTLNLTGAAPINYIHIPGDRVLTGTLAFNKGVLVLDDHNFTYTGSPSYAAFPDSTNMIAADSTGFLFRPVHVNSSAAQVMMVGGVKGVPSYNPVVFYTSNNTMQRTIGVRVKSGQHPADLSSSNYITRYWTFADSNSAIPLSYSLELDYLPRDVVGSPTFAANRWNGSSWTQVPSYIIGSIVTGSQPALRTDGYISTATHPLNGNDFTARQAVFSTYSWTGAVDKDYQVAGNWTPARNNPSIFDILQFNDGNPDTVNNIPVQNISRLRIFNNTNAILRSAVNSSTTNSFFKIYSDYNPATDELSIEQGSALYSDGILNPLRMVLGGTQATGTIAGRLEFINTTWDNNFDFNDNAVVVTNNGILASGTTHTAASLLNTDELRIFGIYQHKHTTLGVIPACRWMPSSTLLVTGYINPTSGPWFTDTVYKYIYDCPNQTTVFNGTGRFPRVLDSMIFRSTGTGSYHFDADQFTGSTPFDYYINNYQQTGGNVSISGTNTASVQTLHVAGTFNQSAGTFYTASTGSTVSWLDFNGMSGRQQVFFKDAAPAGPVNYRITNPAGITLTGTGSLTSQFQINQNGSMRISTGAISPLNSPLTLQYNQTASTLTYDAGVNMLADANTYPLANSPVNLTINATNGSYVTLPFSRTIPGILKMQGGDIDLNTNGIVLGTSATSPGTLTWTAGNIRMTSGSFTRWFATSGLPTAAGTGIGFFPVAYNSANRNAALFFSTATAISTGGTITLSHNNVPGTTTGLSISDGSYTVTDRTNTSWSFSSGNGLAAPGATMGLKLTAGNIFTTTLVSNLRLVQATAVVGTHVAGSGSNPNYIGNRIGITLANLTSGAFHFGGNSGVLNNVYISIANGNWNNPAIWDLGSVPGTGATVIVATGTTVTMNGTQASKFVTVQPGAALDFTAGTFTLDSALNNGGTVNISSTALAIGPNGGGKVPFNNAGILNIASGTLAINGNLNNATGSIFNQTGGAIVIDGNAAGIVANSVPSNTPLLSFASSSLTLSGGSIMFVDPHPGGATGSTISVSLTSIFQASLNHNTIFGDGISTHSGGYAYDIKTSSSTSGNLILGNVIVNGTTSIVPRPVNESSPVSIGGNLTINSNGVYDFKNNSLNLYGNLIVNTGGALYASGRINFVKYVAGGGYAPQFINGNGTIKYSATVGTQGQFNYVYIDNNTGGVVSNFGDLSADYTLDLTSGVLDMGSYTFLADNGINNASSASYVIGKLKLNFPAGVNSILFPVGTAAGYSPVTITGNSTSAGFSTVSGNSGDHPAIGSSTIIAIKSVNKYARIATSGLNFNPGTVNILMKWNAADVDPAANPVNFITARYTGSVWTTGGYFTPAYTEMTITGLNGPIDGDYQVGEVSPTPVITLQPVSQTVCEGAATTFSVGTTVLMNYQWQVNAGSSWVNVSNNAIYSGSSTTSLNLVNLPASMNGYQYRCRLINVTDTAYSAIATLTVNAALTPAVTVNANPGSPICAGTPVLFTATATNGGSLPGYQWKKNNLTVGGNTNTYTDNSLVNGDVINCILTSNAACISQPAASSLPITMVVNPVTSPSITITPGISTTVCAGVPVTFTATPVNGGAGPSYQWKKNGLNVGTNNATYTDAALINGDIITCVLTATGTCASTANATSNSLTMTVTPQVTPSVNITANTGTTICNATTVTFTAVPTNGGITPVYQWKKNGVNVGSNSATYATATLANGDIITCVLTSNAACVTTTAATSNALTITVTGAVTPSVSILAAPGNIVCSATPVTFTATPVNGGSTPGYQWTKNTVNITGATSATYNSSTLVNGDVIACILTSSATCATISTVASNNITMSVSAVVTPTASLSQNPTGTICSGNTVTMTVATNISGGSYQWKVNGINAGTNAMTYAFTPANNDQVTCVVTAPAGSCYTPSTITTSPAVITVIAPVTPTISISGNTVLCSGNTITYTSVANITGGSYQWKVNGLNVGTNSSTYSYTPVNGDVVTCVLTAATGSCVTLNTATSNSLSLTVNTSITPTASALASATNICSGTLINVTATTNITGGSYQWKVNGINTGTNSATLSYNPANGDLITCVITPPAGNCYTATNVTTAAITITVNPNITPTAGITASNTAPCAGSAVTFTATSNVTGVNYQWKVNGGNIGTNTNSYSYTPANGDNVICVITTPAGGCYTLTTINSNQISITTTAPVTPTLSISTAATTLCAGATANFTSTSNISGGTYQWYVNSNPTGTASTYSYVPLNGDVITCKITVPASGCYTISSVNSNAVTMTITPTTTPTLTINGPANAAVGASVTVNATVANAGSSYSIAWKRNSIALATTTVPSVTYTKTAGIDTITATITSTATGCYVPSSSNLILIGVPSGIVFNSNGQLITIYPNPAKKDIVVSGIMQDDQVILQDIAGATIRSWTGFSRNNQLLSLPDIAQGIYFIIIKNKSGALLKTERLLKE